MLGHLREPANVPPDHHDQLAVEVAPLSHVVDGVAVYLHSRLVHSGSESHIRMLNILMPELSYAIKTQLKAPKAAYQGLQDVCHLCLYGS